IMSCDGRLLSSHAAVPQCQLRDTCKAAAATDLSCASGGKSVSEHGWRGRILRAVTGAPFRDEHGRKGWMEGLSRPQPHVVRRIEITLDGLPRWPAPLRIAFLTDFHTGCHSADVARLGRILGEA